MELSMIQNGLRLPWISKQFSNICFINILFSNRVATPAKSQCYCCCCVWKKGATTAPRIIISQYLNKFVYFQMIWIYYKFFFIHSFIYLLCSLFVWFVGWLAVCYSATPLTLHLKCWNDMVAGSKKNNDVVCVDCGTGQHWQQSGKKLKLRRNGCMRVYLSSFICFIWFYLTSINSWGRHWMDPHSYIVNLTNA